MINEYIEDLKQDKPDDLKMLRYEDLKQYYKKINNKLTPEILKKHGFYPNEINWLTKQEEKEMNQIKEQEDSYTYTEKTKNGINTHNINKTDVNKIRQIIRDQTRNKEKTTDYRKIVQRIIKDRQLKIDIDAFNGGRNRAKYYFKYYYYPIKILEQLKEIKYKQGTITLQWK